MDLCWQTSITHKSAYIYIISFNPCHPDGQVAFLPLYRWERLRLQGVSVTSPENKQTKNSKWLRTQSQVSDPSPRPWRVTPDQGSRVRQQSLGGLRGLRKRREEQKVADQGALAKWDKNLLQSKVRLETQAPDPKKQALWLEATDSGAGRVLSLEALLSSLSGSCQGNLGRCPGNSASKVTSVTAFLWDCEFIVTSLLSVVSLVQFTY